MKAIKNFMNKPWTWGTYFKCCGVGAGLSLAILGAFAAWVKWNEKKALKEMQESNLEDHALLSFYQTAKNSYSLMEEIAQMVERHFIVEVMGSRPILFFHFYFWRLNDYGGHYADQVELSAPHHLAGHQQDTEKAVARHRGAVG